MTSGGGSCDSHMTELTFSEPQWDCSLPLVVGMDFDLQWRDEGRRGEGRRGEGRRDEERRGEGRRDEERRDEGWRHVKVPLGAAVLVTCSPSSWTAACASGLQRAAVPPPETASAAPPVDLCPLDPPQSSSLSS